MDDSPRKVQWWAALAAAAGAVAGILHFAGAVSRQRRLRRWVGHWAGDVTGSTGSADLAVPARLPQIRRTLLGMNKAGVIAALGPPPTAAVDPAVTNPSSGDPRPGETEEVWYYPLDQQRQIAMAVTFRADVVTRVEHLHGPG